MATETAPGRIVDRVRNVYEIASRAPGVVEDWPRFVYHDLRRRLGRPGRTSTDALVLRDGTTFGVPEGSSGLYPVFSEVWLHRRYDGAPGFEIRPDDVVIDIGAQVGFFTVRAARAASAGRVISFEPCPPHFEALEGNVTRNDLRNVTLRHEAVWSSDDPVTIRYSLRNGNPVETSVYDIGGTLSAEVPGVTLDQVFEQEGVERCGLLKLDCEGAEHEILRAASDETLRAIDRIAMEWHHFADDHDPQAIAARLRTVGFDVTVSAEAHDSTGYLHAHRP